MLSRTEKQRRRPAQALSAADRMSNVARALMLSMTFLSGADASAEAPAGAFGKSKVVIPERFKDHPLAGPMVPKRRPHEGRRLHDLRQAGFGDLQAAFGEGAERQIGANEFPV